MTDIDEVAPSRVAMPSADLKTLVSRAAIAALSALLVFSLFLRLMNYEMRKDEQLYVPPIRLLDHYRLYEDFFYNHPPGSAWLFHWIGATVGSNHLLFSGRLSVFLAWILFLAAIGGITYALTRSGLISWCVAALTVANDLFLTQTGMAATNNFLPLPFAFTGLGLFVLAARERHPKPFLIGVAGLCLSLAVAFKISAVAFIPPVAVAAFLLPRAYRFKDRILRVVAPLAAGGLVGGMPILIPLVSAPQRFLAHVAQYHTGPHLQYWRMTNAPGEDQALTLTEKLLLAQGIWFSAAGAVAISLLLALLLTAFQAPDGSGRERLFRIINGPLLVVAGALICSAAMSLLPTPSFPQYFAPPLICLPLGLALLFGSLAPETRKRLQPVVVAATLVVLAIEVPRLAQYIGTAARPDRWTVTRVHDAGVAISQRIAAARAEGKVATLSPIYPLEGGLEVYPELATGPFVYRTAAFTDHDLATWYTMTSPDLIAAMFDADPPGALLLGFDEVLERPMLDFARRNGYTPMTELGFKDRYGSPVLYLRPPQK
ncbi:ArnT family glycosyltransferase [Sinorhizobium fredii]|uniref:ArnT family glycosyltransferase n=1 Tax=Rhizobium fredii TaxID=380 RepID=UPI0004B785D2|nr:phospholipid carrier-dependent glycosyltransferase [Sinorhizobium fredii]